MPVGPGRYDDALTAARKLTGGSAILMVIGGRHGPGFSCQATPDVLIDLPRILRETADQMERDMTHVRDVADLTGRN